MRRGAPAHAPWVLSFADLCLVLLGFFVILSARAGQGDAVVAGVRAAFGGAVRPQDAGLPAETLFEPGEAVFRPGMADRMRLIGAAAGTRHVVVESSGAGGGVDRFDRWELAAARTAAVARAVASGGLDPARIALSMAPAAGPATGPGRPDGAQVILVRTHG